VAVSEITLSLIPLEDHHHFSPEPYTLAIPCSGEYMEGGQVEIQRLPFPAGTQFFASAYVPGASGPVRRTVSKVFTVEHSSDNSCLNNAAPVPVLDKRAKAFGMKKRQVSVIGANTVPATSGASTSAAADAPPAVITASVVAPINVIGVGAVPASDSGAVPAATTSSGAAVPPIVVIGTGQIPASTGAVEAPGNVAPAPSNGVVPPVQVIGTSFVTATAAPDSSATASATSTDAAFVPIFTTVQLGADDVTTTDCTETSTEAVMATETTTSCTETPTETQMMESMQNEDATSTMVDDMGSDYTDMGDMDDSEEQPCTDLPGEDSSAPTSSSSDSTYASADLPNPTTSDSPVVHYSAFDDMVNAANSMFHAWNPYKPAYTPST